jgi:ketosteroid isomerase-like protein
MSKLSVLAVAAFLSSGCVTVKSHATTPFVRQLGGEEQLLQADRDFADATHARGLDGWMSFFANDAVRIKYRGGMVKGYDAVRVGDASLFADTTVVLNWQPVEAHVFQRGGVGITIGTSQVVKRFGPDAGTVTYRGRYTTVWRRDASGIWKVIMDTGYPDAPAP